MRNRVLCFALSGFAAVLAPAQIPAPPQTYSFTAVSNMFGPMNITVNRNGSKQLVEQSGASYRLRVLYDFQAHRIYTVDQNSKTCTTQEYTSAYAPTLIDPIGGAEEIMKQSGSMPVVRREAVNGIAARLIEGPMEGQGKARVWLEEKFGFPVKQSMIMGSGPEQVVFEMKKISYAPSAATLFTPPTGCTQIAGTSNANGGHAEMNVSVSAQGERSFGSPSETKAVVQAGDPNTLVGKWDFAGKDGSGAQWTGTLTVTKMDADMMGRDKFSNICDLNLSNGNAGKGMSGPCLYEPKTKRLTYESHEGFSNFSFTAILSPDGASLSQGRWVEGGTGAWSAKRAR